MRRELQRKFEISSENGSSNHSIVFCGPSECKITKNRWSLSPSKPPIHILTWTLTPCRRSVEKIAQCYFFSTPDLKSLPPGTHQRRGKNSTNFETCSLDAYLSNKVYHQDIQSFCFNIRTLPFPSVTTGIPI